MRRGPITRLVMGLWISLAANAAATRAVAAATETPAQMAYAKGVEHFRAGHFNDAILEFNKAYRLDPNPVLVFNMARAFEELKDYDSAITFYRKYLEMAPKAEDRVAVEDTLQALEILARRASETARVELVVTTTPGGARVFVDGRELGVSPIKANLAAGRHFVATEKQGYERVSAELVLEIGPPRTHTFELEPTADVEHRVAVGDSSGLARRDWAWITLGVSGAIVAGGAIAGIQAMKKEDRLDEIDRDPTQTDRGEYEDLKDEGRTAALVADGLLVAGLAGLVASAVLFTTGGSERDAPAATAVPGPGRGLGVAFTY